jgi:hypothetical protein
VDIVHLAIIRGCDSVRGHLLQNELRVRAAIPTKLSHDNAGIFKIANGSSVIAIMSARNMIVNSAAKAVFGGGRYVPPADMKADIVMVGCGDSDLGDRWDCVRLQVLDSSGRRVTPITIKSGPNVYRNGFGATWTVREIHAVFLASQLRNGFSVVVADAGGTEYQEDVPKARAETELLFTIPQTSAQIAAAEAKAKAAAIAAEPTPPDTFVVSVDAQPGGWIITSHNVGYTWRECEATIGANRARIAPLNGSSVVVTAADFLPAIVSTATKPRIRCVAKGQRFEGPFPSELAIRVQSVAKRIWRVTNLTDAPWTDCSAAFGNNTAKVVYFPANDSRTLVETDFTPRIEGTDPEPSAMTLHASRTEKPSPLGPPLRLSPLPPPGSKLSPFELSVREKAGASAPLARIKPSTSARRRSNRSDRPLAPTRQEVPSSSTLVTSTPA